MLNCVIQSEASEDYKGKLDHVEKFIQPWPRSIYKNQLKVDLWPKYKNYIGVNFLWLKFGSGFLDLIIKAKNKIK